VQPVSPGVAGETQETGKPCLDRGDAVERSSAFSCPQTCMALSCFLWWLYIIFFQSSTFVIQMNRKY